MAFWMLDDRAPINAKVVGLIASVLDGDLERYAALSLWSLSGASSNAEGTDGLVTPMVAIRVCPDPALMLRLAHHLVAAGLWHAPDHQCPRCEPVPAGSWRFHDWWDLGYKPHAVLQVARAKAKEGKRPEIVNAVWLRDCLDPAAPAREMTAHCRYCGVLVSRSDRRSPAAPQLDHVDPTRAAGVSNLVVACGECNRRKGARTPADAGMTLRPAPRRPDEPARSDAGPHQGSPDRAALAAAAEASGEAIQRAIQPETQPEPSMEGPPARVTPVRTPGSGSGLGTGSGVGSGSGTGPGSGLGLAAGSSRSKRRRRGRGRGGATGGVGAPGGPQIPLNAAAAPLDAGAHPLAFDPPTGGSPWFGWTGPRSPLSEDAVCPVHRRHLPCDKCATAASEASS